MKIALSELVDCIYFYLFILRTGYSLPGSSFQPNLCSSKGSAVTVDGRSNECFQTCAMRFRCKSCSAVFDTLYVHGCSFPFEKKTKKKQSKEVFLLFYFFCCKYDSNIGTSMSSPAISSVSFKHCLINILSGITHT